MGRTIKILHLEDLPEDAELVGAELKRSGMIFEKLDVDNRRAFINALTDYKPDIIVSDHSLPSFNSFEALEILKASGLHIPFILITATISEEFAVTVMKQGASDYVLKDRMQRLAGAIDNALEKFKLEAERQSFLNNVIASEAMLRQAENIACMGSLDIDLVTQARKWSAGMDAILGYEAGGVEQSFQTFLNHVHPGDVDWLKRQIDYAFNNLNVLDVDFRILTPAGELKHVHTRLLISKDANGNAVRANGFIQDITEKKISELKLNAANSQISKLFNTIEEVLFSKDMIKPGLIHISPACVTLYGYTAAELIADHDLWTNVIHDDDRHIRQENNHSLLRGETVIAQYRIVHKNGDVKWVESKIIPELDENGALIRIDGVTSEITERKKAEIELKESEQRFRELLENSGGMVTVTNDDGAITYISSNIRKILGYDVSAFLNGKKGVEFFHPDDKEAYQQLFTDIRLNPGQPYTFSNRVSKSNGEWMWIEGTVTNLLHVPSVKGVVTNFSDVSERKNAEAVIAQNHIQLREAAQTQAAILNALPPNIALLNENGKIMAVNESWKRFAMSNNLGLPNYGVGYNYIAMSDKATGADKTSGAKIAKGITDVIAGKKKEFAIEYPCDSPTEKRWYQAIVAPINDHTRKGVVVLHINITERKKAEESLMQSEANLRSVFENTDFGIILYDNDLNVLSFNRNAFAFVSERLKKKLRKNTNGLNYFPASRRAIIKQILERLKDGEKVSYETFYDLDDGSIVWFDTKWVGVLNAENQNIGFILTFRNITDKKDADFERNKMTTDLLHRNNDLEQFTYIISHNLRAPVANIQGLANLMNNPGNEEQDNLNILKLLSSAVENLDKVIIDLNHILQTGNQANERIERISLSHLIDEIKEGLGTVIAKNNAIINCDFSRIDEVRTLKSYIYSIFQNLITNSIKYRKTDIRPEVNIDTKVKGDKVLICFEDNGKGIDLQRYGAELFGLYKRFDYSVDGKGMGLFMVKMQVRALGGTITVKSELDKGTEFIIELPL